MYAIISIIVLSILFIWLDYRSEYGSPDSIMLPILNIGQSIKKLKKKYSLSAVTAEGRRSIGTKLRITDSQNVYVRGGEDDAIAWRSNIIVDQLCYSAGKKLCDTHPPKLYELPINGFISWKKEHGLMLRIYYNTAKPRGKIKIWNNIKKKEKGFDSVPGLSYNMYYADNHLICFETETYQLVAEFKVVQEDSNPRILRNMVSKKPIKFNLPD